jgi:hypothetical protein
LHFDHRRLSEKACTCRSMVIDIDCRDGRDVDSKVGGGSFRREHDESELVWEWRIRP